MLIHGELDALEPKYKKVNFWLKQCYSRELLENLFKYISKLLPKQMAKTATVMASILPSKILFSLFLAQN
jgi:hypothetical protein